MSTKCYYLYSYKTLDNLNQWIKNRYLWLTSSMKTLYILRHAKSDWSDSTVDDFDRWLSERWKADLQWFPELVVWKMEEIDHIIASSAKRTAQTADRWARELHFEEGEIEYTRGLYMATKDEILEAISEVEDTVENLLYVWHNDWITDFVNRCWYELEKLPTSWIVCFRFDWDDWKDLDYWLLEFEWFEFPKKYK